jgi:outer membrane protein assembly factor BamB
MKKAVGLVAGGTLLGLLFFSDFLRLGFASDPAVFQANPQHTGVYKTKGVKQFNEVQWKFSSPSKFRTAPIVAGKTIYAGNLDGTVYAIDRQSGQQRWQFKTQASVSSTPAVVKGMVYIVPTNLFPALSQGCQLSTHGACFI